MAIFEAYDANGDGFISKDELTRVFNDIGFDGDVGELFAEADIDQDGKISYSEFVMWMDFDDEANKLGDKVADHYAAHKEQKLQDHSNDMQLKEEQVKEKLYQEIEELEAALVEIEGQEIFFKKANEMKETIAAKKKEIEKADSTSKLTGKMRNRISETQSITNNGFDDRVVAG